MPRKLKPRVLNQDSHPSLFLPSQLPLRPDLLEIVKEKRFVHTARNLTKDEEICRLIVQDLSLGMSRRRVALKYSISRNTIHAMMEELQRTGTLEPLRKETSRLLGKAIIHGLEEWTEAVEEGRIHPSQIPVPVGIFLTQKALIDGDPTSRIEETRRTELTVDQVRAAFEGMKRAKVTPAPAIELQSSEEPSKPQ